MCTKTLYNYVIKTLLKPIKSIDLPERTRRKQRHHRVAIEARTDGHSIDDRDPCFMTRTTFQHWETDFHAWWIHGEGSASSHYRAQEPVSIFAQGEGQKETFDHGGVDSIQEEFGTSFEVLFETITANNGTEFSRLSALEEGCPLRNMRKKTETTP